MLDLGTGDATPEWWTYGYSPFLQSFGGDLIDRNTYTTASGVLNGDKAMAWANWFQGLVKNGYTPGQVGHRRRSPTSSTASRPWSGRAAGAPTNLKKVKDGVVMPPPDFGTGPKIGGGSWQWGISSGCQNTAGALDYLKFSLQPKYLSQFVTKLNLIPATEETAAMSPGWEQGGAKRFFLDESQKFALIRPPTPAYPYITTTFAKAAQDIVAGGDAKKHPGPGGQEHRPEPQEQQQLRSLSPRRTLGAGGMLACAQRRLATLGERHGCHPRTATERWPTNRHTGHQETRPPRP